MNTELKNFVESLLATIDDQNAATNGKADTSNLFNQLIGVKVALATMGVNLDFDINPYYYKDGEASTYTLAISQ